MKPSMKLFSPGLRVVTEMGVDSLDAFSYSQLVVNQVQGDYLAKDTKMVAYLDEVRPCLGKSKTSEFSKSPERKIRRLILWLILPQLLILYRTEVYLWNS